MITLTPSRTHPKGLWQVAMEEARNAGYERLWASKYKEAFENVANYAPFVREVPKEDLKATLRNLESQCYHKVFKITSQNTEDYYDGDPGSIRVVLNSSQKQEYLLLENLKQDIRFLMDNIQKTIKYNNL